jgi:hypothetical protein
VLECADEQADSSPVMAMMVRAASAVIGRLARKVFRIAVFLR